MADSPMDASSNAAKVAKQFPTVLVSCVILATGLAACGPKPDANRELEKAVAALEKVESTTPPTSVQPAQPGPAPAPAQATTEIAAPPQQMSQAVASFKSGDYEDAVTRLQKLRAQPAMSAEQLIALQNAMAAVMGEIYARAAKGDARARQAVKQYEQMQTSGQSR
jgi:hypothetical protein